MTLIPVSSSSWPPACSANDGASRWMGAVCSALISPFWSMPLPSTSMMRPSVAWPTGTEIGAPVFLTSPPRVRPSVTPMAIQRTTPSPICCSTSSTRPDSCSSASKMLGSASRSNSTSTTGPMICTTFPRLIAFPRLGSARAAALAFLLGGARGYETAAAPATISDSSCVIAAWRCLLYSSCRSSMMSPALSEADFIATMRAAISQATFSTTP